MWTDTDIIYAMFILKANCFFYEEHIQLANYQDDGQFCSAIFLQYMNAYDNPADRVTAEESMTRSEFNSRLHSFRLKKDPWNWDYDFVSHMWMNNPNLNQIK